ncbi:hypothetical protein REPUB_Repub05bG0028900 [Reevesia pubescens]
MTVEEVSVVHVAEEEEMATCSSKGESVVEKDKEKENEDLSNGANGRIVKEDSDGDGSYVFVNGNDAVNGDPVELDLEKNGNGSVGEDRGVENLESKGEVKSESDLAKDESDQDKEPIELCHVEGSVDEQKSGDLLESCPVSETSMVDQNGVSELANGIAKDTVLEAAVVDSSDKRSDSNGGSLANDGIEHNVVDSSSKENGESVMTVADDGECNGDGLANDSVEDSVDVSRSKENEDSEIGVADDIECNGDGLANDSVEDNVVDGDSEMAIADHGDCNGDGLANDSANNTVSELANGIAKDTVLEAAVVDSSDKESDSNGGSLADDGIKHYVVCSGSKENEDSVMTVAADGECNEDVLANDCVEDSVVVSRSKENEDSEIGVADDIECNGDGLANDSVEDNVVEGGDSEMAIADHGDCNGDDLANDSTKDTVSEGAVGTRNEQNGFLELPVSDNGDHLANISAKDSVSEAIVVDSRAEQNDGVPVSVSDSIGDDLHAASVEDTISKVSEPEQNESSNRVEAGADCHGPVSDGNGDRPDKKFSEMPETVHPDVLSGNVSVNGGENLINSESTEADTHLEKETSNGSISDECGEALLVVHTQDGISETVVINDLVDSRQNSQQVTLNNANVESGVSDTTAETLPPPRVDDEKVETEVIKSDENSIGGSDARHVENSEVEIEVESGSVDDETKSSCLGNGLESETKISSDSIVSEEAEVSKGLSECDSIEPFTVGDTDEKLAVADVQNDSSLAAPLSNEVKAPAAVENLSTVSNRDISGNNVDTCQEPEGLDEVERKRPFYFLIRVPRYDDESLKEKIRLAQIIVDEKTQSRDKIQEEMPSKRATCKEYGGYFDAAISQERAARDLHRSKRQEIESIQSLRNIEDIGTKIRNMEHMIQHETLPLKDEKQIIREIKQLKQDRDRLSSNMGRQDEVQKGLDQKDQIEERLKSLKKEADQLKVNLMKAEAVTKAAKKKYHDAAEELNKWLSQFKAADDIRQDAYAQLHSLKKQSYEKNKYFWQYRDDAKTAYDLALKRDKEALQNLCVNQVEKLMDLWNKNDEFRKEYVRCNVRSTLRRLRTLDGRSLGPDEEPPVIPQLVNERVAKDHSVSSLALEERTQEKVVLAKAEKSNDKLMAKAVEQKHQTEQKNQTSKSEKPVKSVPPASGSTTASSMDKIEEAGEEKPKRTKEEEETSKAEELRKEEEAAKLREQRRLEEIAKAKEALERKRRIAEKAQARAALRAQKETEEKEKEREKRAKKKERRKMAAAATGGSASVTDEVVSASTSETPAETPKESENKEKPVIIGKRSQKPSQFTKQTKAKSIPPPLRNRGKRRMQTWMWVLLTLLVVFALFLVGNYNFSFSFGLQRFNF